MVTRTLRTAVGLGIAVLSGACLAQNISFSWVSPKYTPCEGVGAAGSFRVYVEGTATPKAGDGTRKVTALSVWVSSAAFTANSGSATARAVVKNGETVRLVRPTPPFIETTPKADESARVYLPQGTMLTIPANGTLSLSASAMVKTEAGSCALGSSENTVPLP
jgi:hypothetical protein